MGAALFASDRRHGAAGAVLGLSAAVAAAFAGENLRALIGEKTGLPDPAVAFVEDAVVVLGGLHLIKDVR